MELAEVSEVQDAPRSRRTVLDSRTRADGTTFELDHLTPGWEPAGAAMRYRERESWGVTFREASGTRNGRRFKTEPEARALFEVWTA